MRLETSWMGRYRHLIEVLVRHRNAYAQVLNSKTEEYDGIVLSLLEWETLEYIIEHEIDDASMIQLSVKLSIPPSTLTKCSKVLCDEGLAAKYKMVGNQKNVILKPTQKGLDYYVRRSSVLSDTIFGNFFKELDAFSDEEIEIMANALEHLTPNTKLSNDAKPKYTLVK